MHPSVREIRKSIANNLVSLQEQLDRLPGESPKNPKSDLGEAQEQSNEPTAPVESTRLVEQQDHPAESESESESSSEFARPSTDADPTVDSPPPTADRGGILDPPSSSEVAEGIAEEKQALGELPRPENSEPEVSKPEESSEDAGGEKQEEITVAGNVRGERARAGEAEELREALEKLLQAGKQQLAMMSALSGRVRDLERKLARRRKLRRRQPSPPERPPFVRLPAQEAVPSAV